VQKLFLQQINHELLFNRTSYKETMWHRDCWLKACPMSDTTLTHIITFS